MGKQDNSWQWNVVSMGIALQGEAYQCWHHPYHIKDYGIYMYYQ